MFALHYSFTTSCIKLARKRGRYFRIGEAPVSVVAAFFVAPTHKADMPFCTAHVRL